MVKCQQEPPGGDLTFSRKLLINYIIFSFSLVYNPTHLSAGSLSSTDVSFIANGNGHRFVLTTVGA